MTILRDSDAGPVAGPVAFGKPARALFDFSVEYHPVNHGSYGSVPRPVRLAREAYAQRLESRVDLFRRFEEPGLVLQSRTAVRELLGPDVHLDEVSFVPNATTGVHVVVTNLASSWAKESRADPEGDGKPLPAVLFFSSIYDACHNILRAEAAAGRITLFPIDVDYVVDDADSLVAKLRNAHEDALARGFAPRLALFETIVSMPGVKLPWERLVTLSRSLGMLSLVDGAHGIGHIDLTHLGCPDSQPDFFVSNCHKWLFSPRGCAVFYVPFRNQHLLSTSTPTSHSYRLPEKRPATAGPSVPGAPNYFVSLFGDTGTTDYSPYYCVADAIALRRDVFGGEQAIREYCVRIAQKGGARVAAILGTELLTRPDPNEPPSLPPCALVNVRLPIAFKPDSASTASMADSVIPRPQATEVWDWMQKQMHLVHNTFIPVIMHEGSFWARLSGQIFLDLDDFEWTGHTLKLLCKQVNQGVWKK